MPAAFCHVPQTEPWPLEWLPALCTLDPEAWTALDHWARPLVEGWCRAGGLRHADAENVAQQVLVGVLHGIARFVPKDRPDPFRAWLHEITRHKIADYRRKQRLSLIAPDALDRLPGHPRPEHATPAKNTPLLPIMRRALQQVRAQVRPATWSAFRLVALRGLPHEAVAERLGITTAAVRLAKCRVLGRLRDACAYLARADAS